MKAQHWTLILLSILIALMVAGWGRVVEWWADMSPVWKVGVFLFCWSLAILIGFRNGLYYALAAVIAGVVFIFAQIWIVGNKMMDEWEQ